MSRLKQSLCIRFWSSRVAESLHERFRRLEFGRKVVQSNSNMLRMFKGLRIGQTCKPQIYNKA